MPTWYNAFREWLTEYFGHADECNGLFADCDRISGVPLTREHIESAFAAGWGAGFDACNSRETDHE